jgi:dipeptidyl aminopeptidase/acylaminoacyl peptidase
MELETMDVSRLTEMGWKAPETFMVKAADGMTDIYGVMWKPFDFNPMKKYPIIANVYPGPQTESVTTTFSPTAGNQRLAQLGFIVIQIGNRGGSPRRSNAYHSYGYNNLRDYGLADKKAGIEQLAARNAWIDVDRVGIFGHSGGGFMTAAAMMLPPYNEFFKVGVSSAGNHDNNIYNQNWSEQHHGLKEVRVPVGGTTGAATGAAGVGRAGSATGGGDPEQQGTTQGASNGQALAASAAGKAEPAFITKFEIKVPTNTELAPNLVGKLLLVHGDMDNNVHPGNTMRLVNALIKANKRFDLMIMPGKAHSFGDMQGYFTQLMYEYFAEHLLGDNLRNSADMKSRGKG